MKQIGYGLTMKRYEYAQVTFLPALRNRYYSADHSVFIGLDAELVAAARATATESTAVRVQLQDPGSPTPYKMLDAWPVLNLLGAAGWLVYAKFPYVEGTYAQEHYDLVRELDD